MEEMLANPCTEARPLSQSGHGERARRKEERKKERKGRMAGGGVTVLYKVFAGRCRLRKS